MADAHQYASVNSEELNGHSCEMCSNRFTEKQAISLCFLQKEICVILTLPVLKPWPI